MLTGDTMARNKIIITFIVIALALMYIGVIGLILIDNEYDMFSICLVTIIMFIFAGCVYKGLFEYKKDNENISK